MKHLLLALVAVAISGTILAQTKPGDVAKMNTEVHDFGKIKHAVPVDYYFEITNTTDKPLIVENSWGSCGCTTPEKLEKPIAPGKTEKMKVQYNAAAMGQFSKDVYIKFAGVDEPMNVKIKGEVLDDAAYEAYVKENGAKKEAKTGGKG